MLLRLPRNLRCLTLTFLLGALFSSKIAAQQQFFTFSYPGPNNLALSASCAGTLFNHLGTPLVQPTTPGAVLTQSYFDSLINGSILNTYFGVQTMQVAWFVADNQGHTAVFSFTINFVDLLPPTFNTAGIPQNLTVNSVKQVPPPPMLTASDNCTPSGSIGIYLPPDSPPPLCESGSILRTWIATDASGNTSTFTQQIVILKDIAPPTITVFPVDSLVKCVNIQAKFQAWLTAQMANFQAVDPSGIASYSNNAPANFPIACPGSVTVTFSATDSCGHAATTTATFQTWDNVPPTTGKLPRDTVVNCAPTAQPLAILGDWIHRRADAVPTEACTPYSHLKFRMQVNGNDLDSAGVVAAFLASFANGCGFQLVGGQTIAKVRGWIPVDFFAEDLCQNLGFVGRGIFAAIDTIAPQFSGPTTVFEDCGGPQNDSLALANFCQNHGGQTATDICSNVIWGNFNWQTSLGQSGIGQPANPATWPTLPPHSCNAWVDATFHLTDDCGNANQRKIRFQLRDTEPPVFAGIVAQDTLFCPNTAVPTPSFSDNCAANPTLTTATENLTPNAPPGAISKIKITWTATDQCGNSATAQTVFTILDTIPPAFSKFPADLTFSCEQIVPPANPASEADATDSCGALANILFHETSTQTADPATCGHYNYLISRTFTALDVQGNSRVRTQKITVRDITPPVIVGFLDTLLGCQTTLLTPTPTTSDNCDPAVAGRAPVSLPDEIVGGQICPDNYSILRKWSATDVCGNTRIFTQTIFVRDTVRPVLAGVPTSANVPCGAIPLPPTVSFTDNCDAPGLADYLKDWR